MKLSPMVGAIVLAVAAFGLAAPMARADDTKNISDGAAKGQATEGTAQPTGTGDTGNGKGQVAATPLNNRSNRTDDPDNKVNNTTTRSNTQHN
jgi:hypothetical protein